MLKNSGRFIMNNWLRYSFSHSYIHSFMHSFIHLFIHTNHKCTHLWAKAAPPSSIHLFSLTIEIWWSFFSLSLFGSLSLSLYLFFFIVIGASLGCLIFMMQFSFSFSLLSFLFRSYWKRGRKKPKNYGHTKYWMKKKRTKKILVHNTTAFKHEKNTISSW